MNLNETLAFVAVARAGSFTAAGRRMGVPKSTLSRQVTRLEERMGARLLQRTTRKLSLTQTGEALFQRCVQAIEEIEEAERIAADVSGTPRGLLRVTAPYDIASTWIADLLPEFRRRYPAIELHMKMTQDRVDLVAEGFDVAVRGGMLPDAGFVARKLGVASMRFYASPEYIRKHGEPRSLAQLDDHDFIRIAPPAGTSLPPIVGPEGPGALEAQPWLTANEFGFITSAAVKGLGVGLLLHNRVQEHVAAGRLVHVLRDYQISGGGLFAIYPSRHHLSPKVRVFVDFLAEEAPAYLGP